MQATVLQWEHVCIRVEHFMAVAPSRFLFRKYLKKDVLEFVRPPRDCLRSLVPLVTF